MKAADRVATAPSSVQLEKQLAPAAAVAASSPGTVVVQLAFQRVVMVLNRSRCLKCC